MPNNEITAIAANDKLLATETQPRKANASLICGTFTQFEVLGKLKLALFLQWTIWLVMVGLAQALLTFLW